ncbi:predicted protein [Naegleria gruberi]|uniref:Predicted protein n=1 Tax=Naegleria gruberi TaxID=5762 RepID=D2VRF4_NAEGR|nr:uncharacterized protein NAEGRDRAFT_71566 [Naegleria gruberi]EFC40660.1 predicted protein [Naegleria gruberi]|eukprot:XP_002673404.1 predicted protein [Naegleria gruberi strain NEG-M]
MSIVEIYAGFGLSGFNGDGYSNLKTLFNTPTSISQNPLNGDLYIADTLNDKIRMVSNSTKLVSSLQYSFNKPQGVFVTKNGNIYIADTGNNLIKKYEISTQKLSIIAGGGYLSGIQQEIDGADGTSLILNSPKSLYVVSNGKNEIVYFTDADRVRSVDENGKFRIVDQNSPQSNLFGIFVTEQGEIYTSSQTNNFLQMKLSKSSETKLFIGSSSFSSGYSGDLEEYSSLNIKFYEPSSLLLYQNSIIIADKSNNCLRMINLQNRMVSTLSGGIVNHPYGENISPLKMYETGNVNYPFMYKNEFYFVEKLNIIRKVSNGKMTTVFGSDRLLTYSNIPQRIYLQQIRELHCLESGELLILSQLSPNLGLYYLNMENGNFSQLSDYGEAISVIGNSLANSSIYILDVNGYFHYYKNMIYQQTIIPFKSYFSSYGFCVIPNYRYPNSTSIFGYYGQITFYEIIHYSNQSFQLYSRDLPGYTFFSCYEGKFYIGMTSKLFELNIENFSLNRIAGLDSINISNASFEVVGYSGEDIPVMESALQIQRVDCYEPTKILLTGTNYISQVSNGNISTIAGLNPSVGIQIASSFARDPLNKVIYFIDTKSLKKYDEKTGITTPLSPSTIMVPYTYIYEPNFLSLGYVASSMIFSNFDRKIYVKEACRVLRIDPETMKFERIIGKGCGTLTFNVKGLDTTLPLSNTYLAVNETNGDLFIATLFIIAKYEISTQMITRVAQFTFGNDSPDGPITNQTKPGTITNIIIQGSSIYFSTATSVKKIEIMSENELYLRTIAGTSDSGYSGNNLPAGISLLEKIYAMKQKRNGDIIILDSTLVRMYEKETGLLVDIAGVRLENPKFNGDGKGTYTSFVSFLTSVEYEESDGSIFLFDNRKLIRKIYPVCGENSAFNSWNNTCVCLEGFYGSNCQPIQCNGTLSSNSNVCNGNGQCVQTNTCKCNEGFEGEFCQIKKASSVDTSTVLIISIVVPIVVMLSLKRKKNKNVEIAKIDTEIIELSDFPTESSRIISSSMGSVTSDTEDTFSRYSNITRIGQGAFGSVFKANDSKKGNQIKAVKIVKFESFTDLNSIMKEASQLSNINHPNIIKVNDYFITSDNLLCIDMDYYECGDLTRFLKENCSEIIVKQILKQSLSALKYVHDVLSIIHRDIKPTNIFIKKLSKEKIEIVIADFGLAKKFQEMKGQSYVGTPLCKFLHNWSI